MSEVNLFHKNANVFFGMNKKVPVKLSSKKEMKQDDVRSILDIVGKFFKIREAFIKFKATSKEDDPVSQRFKNRLTTISKLIKKTELKTGIHVRSH